jgi:NADPH2:quinone reductase
MLEILVERFGDADVLVAHEGLDPVPGPGQVVIDVAVAPVLMLDVAMRQGRGPFPVAPPYVPGAGVAGRVRSVGPDVPEGWIGRTVVADVTGGYAQRVAVDVSAMVPVPAGLGVADAAALLHDGRTAARLMEVVPVRAGQRVLVTGASGALGLLLVQQATVAGAHVIAAAGAPPKLAAAAEQGAATVVSYTDPDWPALVREATAGAGVDVVFDGVGGEVGAAAFDLTAPGGRFSAHGAASSEFTAIDPAEAARRRIAVHGIDRVQLHGGEMRRVVALALAEAATGRIHPVIGQTYPLEQAAEAHRALESRTAIGKTLLLV